jgi:hypothetical protein
MSGIHPDPSIFFDVVLTEMFAVLFERYQLLFVDLDAEVFQISKLASGNSTARDTANFLRQRFGSGHTHTGCVDVLQQRQCGIACIGTLTVQAQRFPETRPIRCVNRSSTSIQCRHTHLLYPLLCVCTSITLLKFDLVYVKADRVNDGSDEFERRRSGSGRTCGTRSRLVSV